MFSILNEIKDNSPKSIVGVISSSIGSAASIYVLVAITGYLTFGSKVVGNIVSMCKLPVQFRKSDKGLTGPRSCKHGLYDRQSCHCYPRHVQHTFANPPVPGVPRRSPQMAAQL